MNGWNRKVGYKIQSKSQVFTKSEATKKKTNVRCFPFGKVEYG